jgi:recombination protein RecR
VATGLAAPLERLMAELAKLPGVGRKTAQRFALHVLKAPASDVEALIRALAEVREKIRLCSVCFNFAEGDLCVVCADPRRERTVVCVVEEAVNVLALERTNAFRGLYHVLGGALSPLKDVGPEDLRIAELLERVRTAGVREVILATSPNVEGEATAVYLARLLKPLDVATTRLAQGLPAGADLEFTDDLTLQRALENRRDY